MRVMLLGIAALVASVVVPSSARADTAPTFAKDVAPILYRNCVSCHRPGEMGPMSLVHYADARPWAKAIRDRVASRSMPPWFADPHYGTFSNDPSLSQHDIDTIIAWVNGGAPQGQLEDMPKLPDTFVEGWQIGTPDVVIEMPEEFQIPASGTINYKSYNVKTTFKEDLWVVATEVRPDDRTHVHHAVVTVIEPGGNQPLGALDVTPLPQDGQKGTQLTESEIEARLKDRAEPIGEHRASPRRVRGRRGAALGSGRLRETGAGRIDAEFLDALHDERHAGEGPHEDRSGALEDAADGRDVHGADQQRSVRNSARRSEY